MLRFAIVFISILLLAAQKPTPAMYEAVSPAELKHHLSFIASDEMKGRDTGSPELDIVAQYLATRLQYYGYKGLGPNGSFFQNLELISSEFIPQNATVTYNGKSIGTPMKDFALYNWGRDTIHLKGQIVAVGYGLNVDEYKDYEPADVSGKIVVRVHLPKSFDDKMKSNAAYTHQQIRNKLFDAGAIAVVNVIPDETMAAGLITAYNSYSVGKRMSMGGGEEANKRTYMLMGTEALKNWVGERISKTILDLNRYNFRREMDIMVPAKSERIKTKNVVAMLPGTDPVLKDEFIGYGSHYDHVGMNDKGEIFNGADDDGSGTVAVLNIAKAISLNPPKRSTFIIFHTAEEKGLIGSAYFAENPLIALDKMVAMINMDMVGSYFEPEKVHVIGADRISRELHDINVKMNKESVNLELDFRYNAEDHPERLYYRSDHYNYAKKGIPVIFFTNDNPNHYHKPSDTVDTINFEKMAKITKLALSTGVYIGNMDRRIKIRDDYQRPAGAQ